MFDSLPPVAKAAIKLAITGAALYAVWRFVPNDNVKVMALGAAGAIALNQLPVLRDGQNVSIIAAAAA